MAYYIPIYNWVGFHPLYTANNQGPFFHCSTVLGGENGMVIGTSPENPPKRPMETMEGSRFLARKKDGDLITPKNEKLGK